MRVKAWLREHLVHPLMYATADRPWLDPGRVDADLRPLSQRAAPVAFTSTTLLDAFCRDLAALGQGRVELYVGEAFASSPRPDIGADVGQLAKHPRRDLQWVSMLVVQPSDMKPAYALDFTSRRTTVATRRDLVPTSVSPHIEQLIDRYAEEIPWWGRWNRAVASAVTASVADQQEHDQRVARKAAWIGGFTGALTGSVAGFLMAFVF